jgi:hypothetical protein
MFSKNSKVEAQKNMAYVEFARDYRLVPLTRNLGFYLSWDSEIQDPNKQYFFHFFTCH